MSVNSFGCIAIPNPHKNIDTISLLLYIAANVYNTEEYEKCNIEKYNMNNIITAKKLLNEYLT